MSSFDLQNINCDSAMLDLTKNSVRMSLDQSQGSLLPTQQDTAKTIINRRIEVLSSDQQLFVNLKDDDDEKIHLDTALKHSQSSTDSEGNFMYKEISPQKEI